MSRLPTYSGGEPPLDTPPSQFWRLGSGFSLLCLTLGQVVSVLGCTVLPLVMFFDVLLVWKADWDRIAAMSLCGVVAFFYSAAMYFVFTAVKRWYWQHHST